MGAIMWDDILEAYNNVMDDSYNSPSRMLSGLYRKHNSTEAVGKILGITATTARKYMDIFGCKRIRKRNKHGIKKTMFMEMKQTDVNRMTAMELSNHLDISPQYAHSLKTRYSEKLE